MLGYTEQNLNDMIYAIQSAELIINADENPAIVRDLSEAASFLSGLWAEGYFDHA